MEWYVQMSLLVIMVYTSPTSKIRIPWLQEQMIVKDCGAREPEKGLRARKYSLVGMILIQKAYGKHSGYSSPVHHTGQDHSKKNIVTGQRRSSAGDSYVSKYCLLRV